MTNSANKEIKIDDVLDPIRKHGKFTYSELVKKLCRSKKGHERDMAAHRIRSILYSQKRRGKIKRVEKGVYTWIN